MRHKQPTAISYGTRTYTLPRSHFKRNLIIILIIVFFLPGIPTFISSGFSVAAWFSAALTYWQSIVAHLGA